MAIKFDAPSTDWQTASRLSVEPRIIYPIPQNLTAVFYEVEIVQNQADFTPLALDSIMATAELQSSVTSSDTIITTVGGTDGFPPQGWVVINSDTIRYTGKNSTQFTGCTITDPHTAGDDINSNAYLVEESAATPMGGELLKWVRKFATVPNDWSDYREAVFQFPGYYNNEYEADYRCPQNLNATIKTTKVYKLTSDPYADLDVANQMFRVVDADLCTLDYVDDSDTDPSYTEYTNAVTAEDLIYAAQSSLERYAGNIWCRSEHQTKAQ